MHGIAAHRNFLKNGNIMANIAKIVPQNRLLSETGNAYMRGKLNKK